jgi:hypothetical protein
MAVTYSKAQRDRAKKDGLHLVTMAARGVEVQAPVSEEESKRLADFIHDFLARHAAELRKARENKGI